MAKLGTRETQGTRHAERDRKAEKDSTPPGTERQENVRASSAMDFDDESSGDDDGGGKVRVKFVTKIPSIRVTETPVAVPETLQRYGLSEVVNHLLGRDPPTPFDMLVMGRFLRSSLQSVMRRHALSGEAVLEVEYLPAMRQPTEAEHADQPDWVSAVAGCGKGQETFVTGCYDGYLRVYGPGCKVVSTAKAHQSPVTGLCAVPAAGGETVRGFLSGSKDMTGRLWRINASASNASLEAVAVLRGHSNSISGVHASESVAYTGDWDGQICMWDVSCLGAGTGNSEVSSKTTKRRRMGNDETEAVALSEPSPSARFKGHAQVVTGLAGASDAPAMTLYSASLDRAVKTWDSERQDCVHTLNAPKAITCLDCSSSGRMLATGHPDARVRIWDTRTKGETLTKTSLSSHVQWITSVAWAPGSETMVLSCAHDGAVKLWDIRSSVPLHSARAHEGKALCCGWEDKRIVSGGADGVVKTYLVPETSSSNADGHT